MEVGNCFKAYVASECTGREITEEWLYHLGVPADQIVIWLLGSGLRSGYDALYYGLFMPRREGDRRM